MAEILADEVNREDTDCGMGNVTFSHRKVRTKSACNYRAILSSGSPLPMLPYTISSSTYSSPVGTLTTNNGLNSDPPNLHDATGTAGSCLGGTFSNDKEADAHAKALGHAASNFYGNMQGLKFNAVVAIGELPQAMSMVRGTARRLTRSIKALKKGDIDEAFNALAMDGGSHRQSLKRRRKSQLREGSASKSEFAANSWLEMKYGWFPLLQDVERASQKLGYAQRKEPADIRVTGNSTVRYAMTPNDGGGARLILGSGSGFVKVNIIGYYKLDDPALRAQNGLGVADLSSAAWELLPYSFVADWFLPVGNYLDALSAQSGLTLVRGCTGVRRVHSFGGTFLNTNGTNPCNLSDAGRHNSFVRTVGVPPTNVILRPRSIGEAFNLSNTITSLALLRQAFS